MLILSRKPGESLIITASNGEVIEVHISKKTQGNQIRIGVEAPRGVIVDREEVHLRKLAEGSHK